jgi:hypothetical protein
LTTGGRIPKKKSCFSYGTLWLITGKISINLKLRKRYQNSNLMAYVFSFNWIANKNEKCSNYDRSRSLLFLIYTKIVKLHFFLENGFTTDTASSASFLDLYLEFDDRPWPVIVWTFLIFICYSIKGNLQIIL